jgi:hypothetical protein
MLDRTNEDLPESNSAPNASSPSSSGFTDKYRSRHAPPSPRPRSRLPMPKLSRSSHQFLKLHVPQVVTLIELNNGPATLVFIILLAHSFTSRAYDRTFELPTPQIAKIPGLRNRQRLRLTLRALADVRLIEYAPRKSRPALIPVPLSL